LSRMVDSRSATWRSDKSLTTPCIFRLENACTRLRLQTFFIWGIARFYRAGPLIRLRGSQVIVIKVSGRWHKVKSNILPRNGFIGRWQYSHRIDSVIPRQIPLCIERSVSGQIFPPNIQAGRILGLPHVAILIRLMISHGVRHANQNQFHAGILPQSLRGFFEARKGAILHSRWALRVFVESDGAHLLYISRQRLSLDSKASDKQKTQDETQGGLSASSNFQVANQCKLRRFVEILSRPRTC